jgi:hypothetical protein
MKSTRLRALSLTLIFLGGWVAYRHHIGIETWLWHLRHGNSVNVGNYIVPVPENWYVESQSDGSQLLVRTDTAQPVTAKRAWIHASILLLPEAPLKIEDLHRLSSLEAGSLKQHGVEPVSQRSFDVAGETISCVGGDKLGSGGILDKDPTSWRCNASGGLAITLLSPDPDIEQAWQILSGIRKKL